MTNVTKTFLPPFEEYTAMLQRAWDKTRITNNGELVLELEGKLKKYLGVEHLWFCNNGTVVLQMALKALGMTGEVITTPFSYVVTTTVLLWENCTPVFVDINERNFCIDASKIEVSITERTQAILATHVYGYPCEVDAIERIAAKHNLKVIYDGAHAFGTSINNRSLLSYGDVSTCSFHATKLFHTGEGGCIVTSDGSLAQKLVLYRQFGHIGEEHFTMGINAKNSEFHAAMGLSNVPYIDAILQRRKEQWLYYASLLQHTQLKLLQIENGVAYNYAYFPVVFTSEEELLDVVEALKAKQINARRYFYPALNTPHFVTYQHCPVAEDIAKRVLCLPLFHDLTKENQTVIAQTILEMHQQTV